MRGQPSEIEIFPERDACIREKAAEIRTPRFRIEREKKLRKTDLRVFEKQQFKFDGEEPYETERSTENLSSELQKLKDMKIEEFKSMREKYRKSQHISRELQKKKNSKVRAFSPRTASKVEIGRIKAVEDMKKAKLKMKKKAWEKTMEGFTRLENFVMVKSSFDPQKDFRDSMIKIFEEKRISRPEELKELLACYLTIRDDRGFFSYPT
ncbi:unnamed protein product [Dovyalis caffra]|uniref:Transcription repressor n=1 Tax=Dovyalis caffra TaxID=77055 RepID=A0AAV1RNT2_9ROSI|nr:unnamed protein product [Dovyalis caffra]